MHNLKVKYFHHSPFYILRSPILYIVPLGLILYMVYLQIYFGDFLYFWHAQGVFGAERSGGSIVLLPQVLWRYIKILVSIPATESVFWSSFFELFFTLFSITALATAWLKKIRTSYLLFAIPAILLPTLTGTLSSMPRYVLVAFPLFIVLGTIKNLYLKIALLLVNVVGLVYFTLLFTSGQWVA